VKDHSHILCSIKRDVRYFEMLIDPMDGTDGTIYLGEYWLDTGIVMKLRKRASDPPLDQHVYCKLYEMAEEICRKHFE